jgi:Sucrase/ferredoxin-like
VELKSFLRGERRRLPQARILFVRSSERRGRDGLLAFVASTTGERAELRRLELERHDELIGVDLEHAGTPVGHPLFLVCTHGKHDRCCAKYGRPLYDAVREQVEPGWVWQSSHVGGDRFAGNLVALPDGVYYGRVDPSEAWAVLEASLAGRVHLPAYRGRSCHGFAAQAAELAVREQTGLAELSAVRVRSIERAGEGWTAEVEAGGAVYDVDVRREDGEPTHLTCSTAALKRPKHYVAGTPRARAS